MQLSQIPVQTPTPFYYYNLELLKKTVQAAKSESAPYGYRVHYAVKANANPVLLRLISQQGLGADCVSGNEIRQALEEHFKKTDHCTGIFTYNDRRAIQAKKPGSPFASIPMSMPIPITISPQVSKKTNSVFICTIWNMSSRK